MKIGRLRETTFTYLANFLLASFLILFSKVVIFTKFNVESDKKFLRFEKLNIWKPKYSSELRMNFLPLT